VITREIVSENVIRHEAVSVRAGRWKRFTQFSQKKQNSIPGLA